MRHLIKHNFLHGTFSRSLSSLFHSIRFDFMFKASFGVRLEDEHFALSMVYFIWNGMAWHDTNAYREDYHIHKGHVNGERSFSSKYLKLQKCTRIFNCLIQNTTQHDSFVWRSFFFCSAVRRQFFSSIWLNGSLNGCCFFLARNAQTHFKKISKPEQKTHTQKNVTNNWAANYYTCVHELVIFDTIRRMRVIN